MSIYRPISKTIINKGGLEKAEDRYVIRKEKGEEEVGIPLVFIYLSSSFYPLNWYPIIQEENRPCWFVIPQILIISYLLR